MRDIKKIYSELLNTHGYQGWWPIAGKYHPNDYSYPKNEKQRFEICVGAILTQNTAWKNVEKALFTLRKEKILDAKKILDTDDERLKGCIRPAGYFNQKARKLKEFSKFYISLDGRKPTREQLLSVWGVGKETADSILLYAYHEPIFVVDAYTRRLLLQKKIIAVSESYDEIQAFFHKRLKKDHKKFNEFHALIVERGKTR